MHGQHQQFLVLVGDQRLTQFHPAEQLPLVVEDLLGDRGEEVGDETQCLFDLGLDLGAGRAVVVIVDNSTPRVAEVVCTGGHRPCWWWMSPPIEAGPDRFRAVMEMGELGGWSGSCLTTLGGAATVAS